MGNAPYLWAKRTQVTPWVGVLIGQRKQSNEKWQSTSEDIKFPLGFVIRLHQSSSYVLIWGKRKQLLGVCAWGLPLCTEPDSLHNEQFLFNQDFSTDSSHSMGSSTNGVGYWCYSSSSTCWLRKKCWWLSEGPLCGGTSSYWEKNPSLSSVLLAFLSFKKIKKPKEQQQSSKKIKNPPQNPPKKSNQNKIKTLSKILQTLEFSLGCTNNLADLLRQMLSCRQAPAAKVHKLPKPAWLNPPDYQGSCLVLREQPKGQSSQGNHSI